MSYRTKLAMIAASGGLCLAGTAPGQVVFENIDPDAAISGINVTNFDPHLVIFDDLGIVGGGELQSLTFTYGFTAGFGGPPQINMDIELSLFIDDGDGVLEPGTDDVFLSSLVAEDLLAFNGQDHEHTVDWPAGAVLPPDATIWFGQRYETDAVSFVNMGTRIFNDFAVGTSNDDTYIFNLDTGEIDFTLNNPGGGAVGAVLTVPAPGALALLGLAGATVRRRR